MANTDINIRKARKEDAPYIAEGIMMAVGDELVEQIANGHGRGAVKEIFTRLAETEDAQYSYRNSFVAESSDGEIAGIVVAYDGAILLDARKLFFNLTKEILGWDIHEMTDGEEPEVETDPSEFYLDSLAVSPKFRNQGIASALIRKVEEKADAIGKPVGLLCAEHNDTARPLYEHLGFREVGKRPFAGESMSHLIKYSSFAG